MRLGNYSFRVRCANYQETTSEVTSTKCRGEKLAVMTFDNDYSYRRDLNFSRLSNSLLRRSARFTGIAGAVYTIEQHKAHCIQLNFNLSRMIEGIM